MKYGRHEWGEKVECMILFVKVHDAHSYNNKNYKYSIKIVCKLMKCLRRHGKMKNALHSAAQTSSSKLWATQFYIYVTSFGNST